MMDVELERWLNVNVPPDSMIVCNEILPVEEQDEIVERALREHAEEAEQ